MERKIGRRAERALEVLKAGGYFRYALERGWHGGEKFRWHLHAKGGAVIKGHGHKTAHELMHLMARNFEVGTGFAEYWELKA